MTQTLYIAEKPSVARAIAAELGVVSRAESHLVCRGGAAVTWCFGHLLEQAEPDAYLPDDVPKTRAGRKAWRMSDLPILPKTWLSSPRGDRGARKQLAAIGRLLKEKDLEVVVNAGDPDREGQLLVDEVIEHFKCRKPVKRFWVSAVDPASIRKGLQSLRENARFCGMRDAARGRSRADWLLGMNLSRAYTLANKGADGRCGLVAVGRVQTPTLAMVARRDYAVRNFVPTPYLAVTADLEAQDVRFRARWKPRPGQPGMDEEGRLLLDLKLGRALVERLSREKTALVTSAQTKRRKMLQPKCYSLADIQIEASRFYGFSADATLRICQSLYETHKITSYPRTDCGYLPESQHADAPAVLAAVARTLPAAAKAVERADPSIKSPTFNDKKVTAHHGIVPVANSAAWTSLSADEQKIYRLIAKRYIANFFPAHEFDATEIRFDIGGEDFAACGRRVVVKGWKALYEKPSKPAPDGRQPEGEAPVDADPKRGGEAEDDELLNQTLPPLKKGDAADVLAVTGREDKTKPPAFFTEGTLVAAMENVWRSFDDPHLQEKLKEAGGIGTPATRAGIIQELKRKGYLYAEKKFLHCSEEGRRVLLKASPKVRSAAMTAAFETKLSQIERGECALDDFVAEYEAFIRDEVAKTAEAARTARLGMLAPSVVPDPRDAASERLSSGDRGDLPPELALPLPAAPAAASDARTSKSRRTASRSASARTKTKTDGARTRKGASAGSKRAGSRQRSTAGRGASEKTTAKASARSAKAAPSPSPASERLPADFWNGAPHPADDPGAWEA